MSPSISAQGCWKRRLVQEENERPFNREGRIQADPSAPLNQPSMAKLPKIVRSRLARETEQKGAGHPDVNLLAAFAEKTLSKGERTTVLTHLARCADCREYLAIASRVVETESSAAGSGNKTYVRRFSPVWRWVSGTAVAFSVLAIIWQFRIGLPPGAQNQKSSAAVMPARVASPGTSVISKMQSETAALEIRKLKNPKLPGRSRKPAQVPPTAASRSIGTEANANLERTEELMRLRVPEEKSAAPAATAFDSNSIQGSSGERSSAQARHEDITIPSSHRFRSLAAHLAGASPVEPNVVWSINASAGTSGNAHGSIQRSLDGGKTWEVVPVADSVDFRAVAANESNVWAGGSEGALFHSSDNGVHWEAIQIAEANANLRGAIVGIDAQKLPRIAVITSLGEEWISMDGGLHWRRSR